MVPIRPVPKYPVTPVLWYCYDDYLRESTCLLCDQPAGSEGLHETATKQLGKKV